MNSSTGIKLVDLKKTTRQFYFAMDHGANMFRERKPKIIFLKDPHFIVATNLDGTMMGDVSVVKTNSE